MIADIKMPGMDGLQLLGRIRDLRPETPTLLITGHGEHDLAVQALRGGAHDYVQKPIDRDYFVGSLSHAIEKRRLSRKVNAAQAKSAEALRELEECLEERTHELRELYRREALARAELQKSNTELETARRRTRRVGLSHCARACDAADHVAWLCRAADATKRQTARYESEPGTSCCRRPAAWSAWCMT